MLCCHKTIREKAYYT